ncbi:MAG: hypothetical protein FJ390_00545 [Verrucomicrobia bacterium]|nr:hypothetical protein [Verrucomicrobiota bacterium]
MVRFLSRFILLFTIATAYSQADSEQQTVIGPNVTVGQYLTFLKAAASTSDPHGLYSLNMKVQITQSKRENELNYFVANGAIAEQMMVCCDIMQKQRYCNWIEHGSPKNHAEAEASTETGTYDLTGPEVIINPDATHYLYNETSSVFCIVTRITNATSSLILACLDIVEVKNNTHY